MLLTVLCFIYVFIYVMVDVSTVTCMAGGIENINK